MKQHNINQMRIGIILTYVSICIKILIELFYTPVLLRVLGNSEYGLYQLAYSTVSYLSLFSLGFGSAYIRYYSRYKIKNEEDNIGKLNGLFLIVFFIMAIIVLICGSILVVNTDRIFSKSLTKLEVKTASILMSILVFNLAITFPASVFQSYITAKEQFFFQRIINILTTILNPFLCLPLLLLGYKSITLVVISTLLTIVSLTINIWFCIKKIYMKFTFRNFNLKLLKEIFYFSTFIFINQIIDQINWNLDKFILGMYGGTASVATYSLGATINNMYLQFSTAISSVFVPRVNRLASMDKADKKLSELFTKVGRIQYMVLMFLLTGYIFIGKEFMFIWGGASYGEAYYIVLLLIIPVTIPLVQNLGIEIQRAKNMHYFRAYVYIFIAILNIFISIPMSKAYGGIGAASGTAISLIIGNIFIMNWYYHYKIKINIKHFFIEIISMSTGLIIPVIYACITTAVFNINSILKIIIWGLTYTIVYGLSICVLSANKYEKALINNFFKKLRGRIKND